MTTPPAIITPSSMSVVIDGRAYTFNKSHPNFQAARDAYKAGKYADLPGLIDIPQAVRAFAGSSGVTVENGSVLYKGQAVHGVLVDRILSLKAQGFSIDPLVAFLGNLMENPSKRSVEQLYPFLELGQLPITADGYFLAYKRVDDKYWSLHSGKDGKVRYRVGDVPAMDRNKVDDNPDSACSDGLHACSLDYLAGFGGARTMLVKINPRDVVSVPKDAGQTKIRVCRMIVVREITHEDARAALPSATLDTRFDGQNGRQSQRRDSNGRFA